MPHKHASDLPEYAFEIRRQVRSVATPALSSIDCELDAQSVTLLAAWSYGTVVCFQDIVLDLDNDLRRLLTRRLKLRHCLPTLHLPCV